MSSMMGRGTMGGNATGSATGLKGTGYKAVSQQQFTPEQMQLFQQMFGQVGPESYLGKLAGGDQSQFEQIEAPAMRQFQGLQGQLASRFSGTGMGARRSSGFQNASNQATSDFASQLQSQRMGIQRQAMQDLRGMSSELLGQRPYDNSLIQEQMPFWKQLALSSAGGLAQGATQLGGMWGGKKLGLF